MNSSELLESFAQKYQSWEQVTVTHSRVGYQRWLSAKQTRYFLRLWNEENLPDIFQTRVKGVLLLSTGQTIFYKLKQYPNGAGLLKIEEVETDVNSFCQR